MLDAQRRALLCRERGAGRAGHRLPRAPRRPRFAPAARRCPRVDEVLAGARQVLVLEDVVDHTNVGAIFRCGAAFGFDAVLLSPRCADPLYRRSVKVGMGAVFSVAVDPSARLVRRPPRPLRPRLHHRRPHPGRRRRADREGRVAGSIGSRWCSAQRVTACPALGGVCGPPGGDRDARGHRLAERRSGRVRGLLRHLAPLTEVTARRGRRASRRDTGRPRARGSSAASCATRVESRSPKTVPKVWSVSCWRQRASIPSPVKVTGVPSSPVPVTVARVGPGQRHVAAGEREAALLVLVELAVAALGQGDLGVAHHARPCARRTARGSRTRRPRDRPRPGRRPARPRRRRTSSRPGRRPATAATRRTP